jgi:hypothetical protein
MEFRATPSFIKAIEDRTVTGIASVMGVLDDGRDVVWPGAFSKTLNENARRIRHLWQHQADEPPIAVVKAIREIGRKELPADLTKQFPEASGALEVTREYLTTARAEEVFQGIKSGAIGEMSFGYDIIKKDYEVKDGVSIRNLREVRLWETSDVQWGMNPATRAVKSLFWDLAYALRTGQDITNLLQAGQSLTSDDLTQIQEAINVLLALVATAEPSDDALYGMMSALGNHLSKLAGVGHKEGRMISAANMAKLKDIMASLESSLSTLEELLGTAEPPPSDKTQALTDRRSILARLAIAEREIVQWR